VAATDYVTEAERAGAAPVFRRPSREEYARGGAYVWWRAVRGADWRHPEGPGSRALPSHPVAQVSHDDALAYARWLGRRLPSEYEWEYAARARRDDAGLHHEPRDARGRPQANSWQGDFPVVNSREDGFDTSTPVGCFAANAFGLFDMLGNVWEWTSSPYASSHRPEDQDELTPEDADAASCSTSAPRTRRFVLKGGSFLCASSFCARYRVSARHAQGAAEPAMHVGCRTAKLPPSRDGGRAVE
jgi:sulfatase modifying factor 1